MAESIERELSGLERSLRLLGVDYERFFTGDIKRPPVGPRKAIEETLKKLGNAQIDRLADRFRLQALQSRYTALTELWDKRIQMREEGRLKGFRPLTPEELGERPAAPAAVGDDTLSTSVKGRRKDLKPLFERYCAARRALGEDVSKIRYERFEELVRRQASDIRRATGARRLVFEVKTQDGKVRLVGRPAPAREEHR